MISLSATAGSPSSHAAIDSINRFVFASTPWPEKAYQIGASGCDGVICGHSGLPFTEISDGLLWHNSGALGMPADDGTPRVWYSLIVPGPKGVSIRTHALDYDYRSAAAKMRANALPEGYAAALENGMWPSTDVLLPAEMKQRGRAITPGVVDWAKRGKSRAAWPAGKDRAAGAPLVVARPKFSDPHLTATGETRAVVPFSRYETLWLNTGTLCNITCHNCYIESSPEERPPRLPLPRRRPAPLIDEKASSRLQSTPLCCRVHRRRAVHEPRHRRPC